MQKIITYNRVIHLSHQIDLNIPRWSGDPPVEFETVATLEKNGYYLRRFSIGEHSSTHINAPSSFHREGMNIDAYSAESLIVPAVVIDICNKAAANADYALTLADVSIWEENYGQVPTESIVILYTGWQNKWHDPKAFLNDNHFPGFGEEATRFLIQERKIAGVGIDTHGVDPGQDTSFTTNSLVLEKPRLVLENLTNLDQLPPIGTTLIVGILRLSKGSGSPAAVMALLP